MLVRYIEQVVSELDFDVYRGIVCISGDGTVCEVLNSLMERKDRDVILKVLLCMVHAPANAERKTISCSERACIFPAAFVDSLSR